MDGGQTKEGTTTTNGRTNGRTDDDTDGRRRRQRRRRGRTATDEDVGKTDTDGRATGARW
jgi:hypothetical protein